jgi:hypothetical protein
MYAYFRVIRNNNVKLKKLTYFFCSYCHLRSEKCRGLGLFVPGPPWGAGWSWGGGLTSPAIRSTAGTPGPSGSSFFPCTHKRRRRYRSRRRLVQRFSVANSRQDFLPVWKTKKIRSLIQNFMAVLFKNRRKRKPKELKFLKLIKKQ